MPDIKRALQRLGGQPPQPPPPTAMELITQRAIASAQMRGTGGTPPMPGGYVPPSLPGIAAGSPAGTVRARQVIISGAGGLFLVYSPSAGFGNLIYSVAGAAGTDSYGNAFFQGATSYVNAGGGTYWALNTLGVTQNWYVSTAGAGGPYTQFADIGFGFATPPNLATLLIQANNQVKLGSSGAMIWNDTGSSTPNQLTLPGAGGPFVTGEGWHTISSGFPTGITGFFKYRLLPWNVVEVFYEFTVASTAASGTFTMTTLAAPYVPATAYKSGGMAWFTNSPTTVAQIAGITNMRFNVDTSGNYKMLAFPGGAVGSGITELDGHHIVPTTA